MAQRYELYEKVYDDLTKAVARAKWICRQKDAFRKISQLSADPTVSTPFVKRGRPKGSKNLKPRVTKAKVLVLSENLCSKNSSVDAYSLEGPLSAKLDCPLDSLSVQEKSRQVLDFECDLNASLGHLQSDLFQSGLEYALTETNTMNSDSGAEYSIPECWELPLP